MRQYIISILLITLLLSSCAERPSSQETAQQKLIPTSTSQPPAPTPSLEPPTPTLPTPAATQPRANATASPTPRLSLPQNRPWIAYPRSGAGAQHLVLLEPESGATVDFPMPPGSIPAANFLAGLSPDGRYFVYYQGGRVGEYEELYAEPADFQMIVMDLRQGEVVFSMKLLSPRFPEVLKTLVTQTEDEYWMVEDDRQKKIQNMYDTMQSTVLNYLRSVAWAPDGSLLAFASQNPGPSSDMNFFKPSSRKAWQVTSETGHVLELTWAPDSSVIALETTHYDRHMRRVITDVLSPDGFLLASIDGGYFFSWHDPQTILTNRSVDFGDPGFRLRAISTVDGSRSMLWEGSFMEFALTPDLSSILVSSSEPTGPENPAGLFLRLPGDEEPLHLSESVFWKVAYWGTERFTFAASAPETGIFEAPQTGGTYGISQTGELTLIDDGDWFLLPSPDKNYLAAYGPYDSIKGLRMFDNEGKLLAALSDQRITCLQWNAASTSLAYQVGDRLYVWEIGAQAARLVAGDAEPGRYWYECGFTWVNDNPLGE